MARAPALSASIQVVDRTATLVFGRTTDVTAEELFLVDADKDARLREAKAGVGKAAECAAAITTAWEALQKPATAPSTAFSAVAATYGAKTMERARTRLGITVDRETDPETGRVVTWTWTFPA